MWDQDGEGLEVVYWGKRQRMVRIATDEGRLATLVCRCSTSPTAGKRFMARPRIYCPINIILSLHL